MKPDFPSLLAPGLHKMSLDDFHSVAVEPFPEDARRKDLFSRLMAWRKAFKALGMSGSIWFDGSFMTSKPEPDDIDMVVWNVVLDTELVEQQIPQAQALFDKPSCKVVYGLDIYLETPADEKALFHREAYWKGLFGFCHDRATAKGFAEVVI